MNTIRKIIFLPLSRLFYALSSITFVLAINEEDIRWLKEHADD